MVIGGFVITENKIRARQEDPKNFQEGSFRTIRLASGVKAIIGKKKGETTTTVQSILFDKNKFTTEQAKEWLQRNKSKFGQAVNMEEEKVSLFNLTLEEHLTGHLPPLTPTQIQRLLEVAGPAEDETTEEEIMSSFVKRI